MKDWIPGEELTVEDALILIKELKTLTVTHRLCKLGLSAEQSAKLTVHAHETARRIESFLLDVKKAAAGIGGEVLLTMYDRQEPVSNADASIEDMVRAEYEEQMHYAAVIETDHETIYSI